MDRAKAVLSTLTCAQTTQSVIGGFARGGTLMVIGAVGPLSINAIELITKTATVKG